MTRLPTPGGDSGTWGTTLNDYLSVEHNTDGTLKRLPATLGNRGDDLVAGASALEYVGPQSVLFSRQGILPGGEAGADLTTSLQAVIDANPRKRVVFDRPDATYHIRRLTIPAKTELVGDRVTLFRDTALGGGIDDGMLEAALDADTITMEGLTLRSTVARRLIVCKRVTKLLLRDMAVTQMSDPAAGINWATWFIDCQDVLIEGYYQDAGTAAGQDGLHFSGGKNVVIHGCRIKSGDDAISLTLTDADGHAAGVNMENFSISNCVLTAREARIFNIWTNHTDASIIQKITVSNITGYSTPVVNAARGFVVETGTGSTAKVKDIKVSDVTVDCSQATVGGNGADFNLVDGLRVHNLTVLGAVLGGISVNNCPNATLIDVESRDNRNGRAIQITSPGTRLIAPRTYNPPSANHHIQLGTNVTPADDCLVIGAIMNGGPSGVTGIYLRNAHRAIINGNRVLNSLGNGIIEDATLADFNMIFHNDVTGAAGTKLTIVGANSRGGFNIGVTLPTYAITNVTTDRTFDVSATTINEIGNVLGTLIADLRAKQIVG